MEGKECRGRSCEDKPCKKGDWKGGKCKEGKCKEKWGEKCKEECDKKKKKFCKKLKKDIMVAVAVLGGNLNPPQQDVMRHFLKKIVKKEFKKMKEGKCKDKEKCKFKKECRGESTERCKEACMEKKCDKGEKWEKMKKWGKDKKDKKFCPGEFLKCIVKRFLVKEKDLTIQRLDTAIESLKKLKGISTPAPGTPHMFPPHKKFGKKVAKLVFKMHKKGIEKKECMEKFAEKFWEKQMKCKAKKMKKKLKKLAKKVVFFHCDECDKGIQKGMVGALTKAMCGYSMMKFKKMKHCGAGEPKKEEGKEAPAGPAPQHCGPQPMHKGMKKMFKHCMMMQLTKFAVTYIDDNKEIAKLAHDVVKKVLCEKSKEGAGCCPDKCKMKIMGKLVSACISMSAGEKKPEEFYTDFIQRCCSAYPCCCNKACLKSCCKMACYGLLFSGVKCKCTRKLAACWAGTMCCKANGKDGCPKEACAEYINKWIKDYMPAVEAGMKALGELKEEMKKEDTKEKMPMEKLKMKMFMKFLKNYLRLYCADGKFNKDDFIKRMKEAKEANIKYMGKFMKEGCCGGCKCEDKK